MLPDAEAFFEWCAAQRLNAVEWLLLGDAQWGEANQAPWRARRLRRLAETGRAFGLRVGVDVPLALQQQHAWFVVDPLAPRPTQRESVRKRLDWLLGPPCTFDFVSTEMGTTEFTSHGEGATLELLDLFADHARERWGAPAFTKIHCSQGQTCPSLRDKRDGGPLNYNYLPMYASPNLGVMPHTVQAYGFHDNAAGIYGNQNFSAMFDYLAYEVQQGDRQVLYYGETAYWVSVDVDVPLFLPVYAHRRASDLRRLAALEARLAAAAAATASSSSSSSGDRGERQGPRASGMMNFDSGWEWGYWLSDVVTARAAWDPLAGVPLPHPKASPEEVRRADRAALRGHLARVCGAFGPRTAAALCDWLTDLAEMQLDLLLHGEWEEERTDGDGGPGPGRKQRHGPGPGVTRLSGIAYLAGWDTWTDTTRLGGAHMTQPDKVLLREALDPLRPRVLPLLGAAEARLRRAWDGIRGVRDAYAQAPPPGAPAGLLGLLDEFVDAAAVTALRAAHVRTLYQAADPAAAARVGGEDGPQLLEQRREKLEPLGTTTAASSPAAPLEAALALLSRGFFGPGRAALGRRRLLRRGRALIAEARAVVRRREARYRVPTARVAAWRWNPTVYRYGYLWAAGTLYYWWRDQGIAEKGGFEAAISPCYLNRMDPTEVAFGWGMYLLQMIRVALGLASPLHADSFSNCLGPPLEEYQFPRDLHRY